jgi:hypothetical protein
MSIVLVGSSSGSITLQEPAVAGTTTLNLPATSGTVVVTGTTPTLNGITFPATQSPSADANTLDDYEEGTWTPSLGGTTTYNGRFGTYTKVGNLVTVLFSLNVNSIGTGTRSTIAGLPFTPANMSSGTLPLYSGLSTSLTWAGCYAEPDAIIYLTGNTGTVATTSINGSTAVLGSGTIIYGAITFRT